MNQLLLKIKLQLTSQGKTFRDLSRELDIKYSSLTKSIHTATMGDKRLEIIANHIGLDPKELIQLKREELQKGKNK